MTLACLYFALAALSASAGYLLHQCEKVEKELASMKSEAISLGYATWETDPETGEPTFKFKFKKP